MLTRHWFRSALVLIACLSLYSCKQKKTGFVDVFKLVSEFELQKEYTAQARRDFDQARAAIDSAVYVESGRDSVAAERARSQLYAGLSQKAEAQNKQIEQVLWTRLNPYISEFGKEHGYAYIYGANGTGNVLYAAQDQDITAEVVKYVNNRYHDKK